MKTFRIHFLTRNETSISCSKDDVVQSLNDDHTDFASTLLRDAQSKKALICVVRSQNQCPVFLSVSTL